MPRKSEFSALINSDASAGIAVNLPLDGLSSKLLSPLFQETLKNVRVDAGVQVIGQGWGTSSVILGLHGSEAAAINGAVPRLIVQLEKSGMFAAVCDNVDIHRGIVIHSVVPSELPPFVTTITGYDVEVLVGQGKKTFWLAVGSPETLADHLCDAIDLVEDVKPTETANAVVSGKFEAARLPLLSPSPDMQPNVEEKVEKRNAFRLSIDPRGNSLKIQLIAEEGILKMIGNEWARQVDEMSVHQ